MSNSRAFRRRRPRITRAQVDAMTAITCAARNCICDPDVETRHASHGTEQWIRHDDWCPAANTGTAYGIVPGRHTTPEDLATAIETLTREAD